MKVITDPKKLKPDAADKQFRKALAEKRSIYSKAQEVSDLMSKAARENKQKQYKALGKRHDTLMVAYFNAEKFVQSAQDVVSDSLRYWSR